MATRRRRGAQKTTANLSNTDPPSQPTRWTRSSRTESSLNPASSLGAVDAQLPANHDPSSNLTSEPPPACSNAESHPTPIPALAPISTAPARGTATALPPGMQTMFRIQGKFILYFSPSHRSNLWDQGIIIIGLHMQLLIRLFHQSHGANYPSVLLDNLLLRVANLFTITPRNRHQLQFAGMLTLRMTGTALMTSHHLHHHLSSEYTAIPKHLDNLIEYLRHHVLLHLTILL